MFMHVQLLGQYQPEHRIIIIMTSYAPISSKIELIGATKPRD